MKKNLIEFDIKGNELGYLIPLESNKNVPFEIKRVFYIYNIDMSTVRGKHTQKKLREIVICIRGKCKIKIEDKNGKKIVELSKPSEGLYIGPMVWREFFDFSSDCILLAIADDFYDESDYIIDHEEFRKLTRK